MNKQEYLTQLTSENGYCSCPPLQNLFELRKRADKLEALADFYKGNVDLENPVEADREILEDYRDTAEQLHEAAEDYHVSLTHHIKAEKLYLTLHDPKRLHPLAKIGFKETQNLTGRGAIMTIHCANCDQQIDLST
jgi:hypothetical protein